VTAPPIWCGRPAGVHRGRWCTGRCIPEKKPPPMLPSQGQQLPVRVSERVRQAAKRPSPLRMLSVKLIRRCPRPARRAPTVELRQLSLAGPGHAPTSLDAERSTQSGATGDRHGPPGSKGCGKPRHSASGQRAGLNSRPRACTWRSTPGGSDRAGRLVAKKRLFLHMQPSNWAA